MSRSGRTMMRDGAGVDLLWERRWIWRQRAVAPHPSGGHAVRRLRGGRGSGVGKVVMLTRTQTRIGVQFVGYEI
ncbi:mucin-2-like [Iris pallida]|uniref:Mucin-2-like n=1 Tax=Iris pallida TaxID=29817 RepID=A0AAX6IC30_IRIPA|nr:mucin-2-like [Iris pallida]